jgi:DNA-binding MarR family transcriptional regulator
LKPIFGMTLAPQAPSSDRGSSGRIIQAEVDETAQAPAIAEIRSILKAIRADVPTYGSLIGYKIFLLLCEHELRSQHARLKDLYLDLGHSHGAVRRLVRMLQEDGWIVVETSNHDRRARHVRPTPRLRETIARFANECLSGDGQGSTVAHPKVPKRKG